VARPSVGEGTDVFGDGASFDPEVLAGLEELGVGVDGEKEIGREGDVPGVE